MAISCSTAAGFVIFLLHEDKNRREPPLPSQIDRIVSLAPNITEILFELGLGEKIAAVSSDSDYPDEASAKKKVGTLWQSTMETAVSWGSVTAMRKFISGEIHLQ